ncbi:MAG: hypothetical protein CMO31_08075 [Trueperaceae bacterium]|jgi:outer membrane protein insertion porin family|nr:hypothetical protein [Trueperaceae bacterium]
MRSSHRNQCRLILMLLRSVVIALVVLVSWCASQDLKGPLAEVVVEGTDNYTDLIKVVISARPGTPVERIQLEAERNRIYSLGTFEEVSVSLQDRGAGPVLMIVVRENPKIFEVSFDGVKVLEARSLKDYISRQNLVEAGGVYNTIRAEEAIRTLQSAYRQVGFPFDVSVVLTVEPVPGAGDGYMEDPVRLRYEITENQSVNEIAYEGISVIEIPRLKSLFRPLRDREEGFDLRIFKAAIDSISDEYQSLGYRQSGVNTDTTELVDGVLTIRFRELRIISIDTTAIGIDPKELSSEIGDLFNFDVLLEDVRRISKGRSSDVRLVPRVIPATGEVRVIFELGPPETAGPVAQIRIEGNTVLDAEEILEVLELRKGDTFTSTLAEEDFFKIRDRYAEDGYLILNQSDFNYLDGVYVQRITELRISDYRVTFRGGKDNSEEFLVTRQMPNVGTVANEAFILEGLRALAKEGAVRPLGREIIPTEDPEMVIVNLIVEETNTGLFTPSAQYATNNGFSAAVAFSEANFFGRAHNISADLTAQTSDIGFQFGAAVSYAIPWVYFDRFGFRDNRTSVAFSLFSEPTINTPLTADGSLRVLHPDATGDNDEANLVRVGEYTSRKTGVRLSVGRSIFQDTFLKASMSGGVSQNWLEPPSTLCTFDQAGNVENGGACFLPEDEATSFIPLGGLSSFVSTRLTFDNRDSIDFPRTGVVATSHAGIGFGNDLRGDDGGRQNYVYQQLEFGVKTYAALKGLASRGRNSNHVVAFRVNAGHQLGNNYPASRRFLVGRTNVEATLIRGYKLIDFNFSRTYLTGSLEYRYDFELATAATQTVIGIAFVDLGYASSMSDYSDYGTPVVGSAGLGVQVNLGFGGVLLPALRFDYGFSQRNPKGVFSFRLGPVF